MHNYMPIIDSAALVFITHSMWGGWHHVEVHNAGWWRTRLTAQGLVYSDELTKAVRKTALDGNTEASAKGLKYRAQHLWTSLQVYINPAVMRLPEHAHVIGNAGCFAGQNHDNPDIGDEAPNLPCEGGDALPPEFQPPEAAFKSDAEVGWSPEDPPPPTALGMDYSQDARWQSEGSALQLAQADRKAKDLIACIVEPRADQALDHVVQNVADFLGPSVLIQLYHGNTTDVCDSKGELSGTCQLHREGRVELHSLGVDNLNASEYSQLLTTKSFWETKLAWGKTLIFQTDSVFCNATEEKIDNFMHLDYVGARAYDEWKGIADGGNGGFSLRNTQMSLDCSSERGAGVEAEDAFFIRCFRDRGGRLATKVEEERFATQNYFAARSLGAHQINAEMRWTDKGNLSAFQEYCPEYLETMKLLGRTGTSFHQNTGTPMKYSAGYV